MRQNTAICVEKVVYYEIRVPAQVILALHNHCGDLALELTARRCAARINWAAGCAKRRRPVFLPTDHHGDFSLRTDANKDGDRGVLIFVGPTRRLSP